MRQGHRIILCTTLWLSIASAAAFARDNDVVYHRLIKRAPLASTELAEISSQTDAQMLAAGFQPVGIVAVMRPELLCDFEHQCSDLPEPYDATALARKEAARHGAQVLTLPCNNADVVRPTPPKGFFSTLGIEQECRTVPDVHAPGKYKQECQVARRYWDRTLLRVSRGVAWHRSSNVQAESNLKKGYRLLFPADPLLRACLEENSAGIMRNRVLPSPPSPSPRKPPDDEMPRMDPRDEIPPTAGQSALFAAAAANDVQGLQAQFAAGAAIDTKGASGETALHYAAAAGGTESMRILLEHGAAMSARNSHGATPLYIAARHGHRDAVALLIDRGAPIDDQSLNFLDLTPLMVASKYGHIGVVQELLARGADFELRDREGLDALAHAVAAEHDALIRPLTEHMNPEQRKDGLRGAMYVASTQNKPDTITELVEAGADLEALYTITSERTFTPLMLAAGSGHVEVAQALLAAGANPNNSRGAFNAFTLAIDARYRRVDQSEMPRRTRLLAALLDAGADATHPRIVSKLAIQTPPKTYGLEPIVERLLEQGALPERSLEILLANALRACHMPLVERIALAGGQALIDRKDPNLLAAAVTCGEVAVVDYLVQHGYEVDQRLTARKETSLMRAAQNGSAGLVKFLLAQNADPSLVDAEGRDAHAVALEHGRLRVVKMLREVQR